MFMLKNVGKLIFGTGSQELMVELPQGQLYLVRPLSPKGYSELIFKDATACIRKTGQDFQYQLVVQRVYEEGEAELLAEEEGEEAEDLETLERDEKTFLLDEALHFRVETRLGGDQVLAWRDLSGDAGDVYEFVCDTSVAPALVEQFELVAKQCQYERKYKKPHATATDEELAQFVFDDGHPIPQASPIQSPTLARSSNDSSDSNDPTPTYNTGAKRETPSVKADPLITPTKYTANNTTPAAPIAQPEFRKILANTTAELHFFDFPSGAFVLQDAVVTATVSEVSNWSYYLKIDAEDRDWLGIDVVPEINPVFNFEYLSFIFNQFTKDGSAYSWLLRFKDQPSLEAFQEGLMQALWEHLNEQNWSRMKEVERDYVTDVFADLTMNDVPEQEESEESEEEEDGEELIAQPDEDDVGKEEFGRDLDTNKQLAVGYKHDRSFVVRGSKIGVFRHTPKGKIEFHTNISRVETPKGDLFSPKKVMLHNEDRDMLLQKDDDPNSVYRMDLEYGKVVDEYKVHDEVPLLNFAPENKFAQMTGEQTFLGISKNALYRVDPRLSGNKLVESQLKQYASKNDFSNLATTEKGYIAVVSNKGDIRLYDRLGINAKTNIPGLGDPVLGVDASADGRWLLATCKTYLLLIDCLQKEGKNQGKLGFERSFAADKKPQPRRLTLMPEHVAQFHFETGKGVSFTQAKFNTGAGASETSIITATGPYIVEWDLPKVLRGSKTPYLIKRYTDEVKADDFQFGTDKNIIVALPHEISNVDQKKLKKPTRESIVGEFSAITTPRRSSGPRTSRLARKDIVDSPY